MSPPDAFGLICNPIFPAAPVITNPELEEGTIVNVPEADIFAKTDALVSCHC